MSSSRKHFPIIDVSAENVSLSVSRPLSLALLGSLSNPQPRCPVVLLLDCSSSMDGRPIEELQRAVSLFYEEMTSDPVARLSVEICVIPFGGNVKVMRPFETVMEAAKRPRPSLTAEGTTPMGEAISLGLDQIRQRRDYYRQHGHAAYKPWMVLMTDGQPNDDWQEPAAAARRRAEQGRLFFIGLGIGDEVDMGTLRNILPADAPPMQLKGLRFAEFFRWLSDSLKVVTSGSTTQQRSIPAVDDYDWTL